jgi:hypothetical protein
VKPLLAALLLAAALGGCIRAEEPTTITVNASSPTVFQGYDHAAANPQPGQGTFAITADPRTDSGTMVATFVHQGQQWRVEAVDFAESPGRAFQEGGVRADFEEHGDSGNGDPNLPRFFARLAAWGQGRATVDGQPYVDPVSGSDLLAIHAMVARDAPRQPGTLRVLMAEGDDPYDPANPANGRSFPNQPMVLLNVQGAAAPADVAQAFTGQVQGPNFDQSHAFEVNSTNARIVANISVAPAIPPGTPVPPVGQLQFDLLDPSGAAVATWAYAPQPGALGPVQGSLVAEAPLPAGGAWSVRVSGGGVAVDYALDVLVDHADGLFLHVVYTSVQG